MSILDRDLTECQTFSEISQWRAEKQRIDKKSGDDYTGILTNIYKEPTHFIYELLQNADDAKATNVKFVLSQDKIEFFHDGTKEFTLNDIISITGVGNSSKGASSQTAIGKFGVGFKAVFAVTDKPLIFSTTYNFQIENLSVPSEIEGRNLEGFTTIFQLDFKDQAKETLFRRNETLLRNMSPETILFLRNICRVDIVIANEQLPGISVSRDAAGQAFSKIRYQTSSDTIELLKFTRDGCSIVYQLRDGAIMPIAGSKISVFFPTIIDSNLPFLVDAPFQTSTTRESIDFELPHNTAMVQNFKKLFLSSISTLRQLTLFTVDTFNTIMPIRAIDDSEDFPIYKVLQTTFLDQLKKDAFVPTSRGGLRQAAAVQIATDADIVSLLRRVPELHFAHPQLSTAAIAFIKQAGAKTFEPYHFLQLITRDTIDLSAQSDDWLYRLYEYCLKAIIEDDWYNSFTRNLKQTPLIRTRANTFTAAYDEGNPNVFRPSRGIPGHRTIHPMFLTESSQVSDETKSRMKSFLSELGITERKPVIVLKEDYFRHYEQKSDEDKLGTFKAVVDLYSQSEPKDKADIEAYLKNVAFVPSETGEFKLASKLYDSYNTDLQFLFGQQHPELFCAKFIGENAMYRELCLSLGLISQLQVIEEASYRSDRAAFLQLHETVGSSQEYGSSTKEFKRIDYTSPVLSFIFADELTQEVTARLAPLLLHIKTDQLKESFSWSYYGTKQEAIGPSTLCTLLEETSWIYRNDQMIKPSDIAFDDFCELYKLPRDNVLQNLAWSNDDIIKQLSEKEQEAIKLMRELNLTPEEMHELRRVTLEKRKKTEKLTKRMTTPITEQQEYAGLEETPLFNLREETEQPAAGDSEEEDKNTLHSSEFYEAAANETDQSVSTRTAAKSNWSNVEQEEREVLRGLVDWYEGEGYNAEKEPEDTVAYTLNKGDKNLKLVLLPKNNSGYNIEISENGTITKTIAIIKADLEKKRFTISESQWNLSKRDDIQHSIYLVSRQGETMNQIVIDDLRERINDGRVKVVPGVIYYA